MALTDVSLIEFSAIPALDPLAPIGPAWLLLVQDNVSGAVWRATTAQAKTAIAPTVVGVAQTAPVVSLVLSANTGQVGTLITLTANASGPVSPIAKVEFFDNGSKIGAATAQPYQVSYTPAGTGRHSLVAVATDAAGTATTSAPQNLDISAPVVAAVIVSLSPIPPGSVGTALSLTANASIAGGSIAKVEFFDGASIVGVSASSPFGCSYVPTTPGPHYFSAKATTSTGASAISPALTVQVVQPLTITNQPPSVSLSVSASSFTLGGTTTLSALAADVDGAVVRVDFYDGTTLLSSQSSQGPYTFDYTPTKSGGHALSAKATDNLGSFTVAQVNITVNSLAIPALAPTNVVAALVAPSAFTPSYSIGVSWLAPAANGSLPISGYYIYRDGGPVPIGSSALLNFTDSYVRASEVHSYVVAAFTGPGILIGALSIATPNLTVPAAAVNTVPGAPTMGTPIANATSISVYFTPSANTGGSVVNYYDIYRNNVKVGSTPSTYYPDSTGLVAGMQYVYTAIAVNAQGPSPFSNPSVGVYLTAAAATPVTAPGAPTGVYGTASSNSVLVYFTAPASNGGAAITGFNIYRSGTFLATVAGTATTYPDGTAVNGQTYLYTVAATNSAGTGPQSASATVVMPAAAVANTVAGAPTNASATLGAASATPTITVNATAPASTGGAAITGYTIYRNGVVLSGATNVALPYADTTAVNGTAYIYGVSAVNSAGTGAAASTNSVTPVAPAVVYNTTLVGSASGPVLIASGQPGAGIQLNSPGGADVLKFNSTTGSSLAQRMNIYIAGTQVAAVDFPAAYANLGFSYTSASTGITRSGTFANGAVTIQ